MDLDNGRCYVCRIEGLVNDGTVTESPVRRLPLLSPHEHCRGDLCPNCAALADGLVALWEKAEVRGDVRRVVFVDNQKQEYVVFLPAVVKVADVLTFWDYDDGADAVVTAVDMAANFTTYWPRDEASDKLGLARGWV